MLDLDRFWSFVDVRGPNDCWLWTGTTTRYPIYYQNNKQYYAHRLICEHYHGDMSGLVTRHLCGNALCVNPAHLKPGTQAENNRDKVLHGTTNKGKKCPWLGHPGERNAKAKLTEQDVLDIRSSDTKVKLLAEHYNVSREQIRRIKRRNMWAHI
jgi:hypothetical protein